MSNRVIVTKHRIYELAADAQGVPVEDYFAGVDQHAAKFAMGVRSTRISL